MAIQYFCPRWGSEGVAWDDFLKKVKEAGYHGVEYAINREVSVSELHKIWDLAERHGLKIIPQHYDTYEADFATHLKLYRSWFEKMRSFSPLLINSQTGKDFFGKDQNREIVAVADTFSQQTGIPVCHETHRNKFLFAAHVAKEYLQGIPNIRLTLDVSHWVCVAESLLEDQAETMLQAISHTDHIHARIGYAEGPQVPDPRMEEWQPALQAHLAWWDKVVEAKAAAQQQLTITCEFGPFPYMINAPSNSKPIASQWEVNVFMLNFLKKRYS